MQQEKISNPILQPVKLQEKKRHKVLKTIENKTRKVLALSLNQTNWTKPLKRIQN